MSTQNAFFVEIALWLQFLSGLLRDRRVVFVLANVLRPFDVAVGGVGKVADLKHKQDPLSRHYVYDRFQNCHYVPSDPLFAVTEQYQQTVGNAHCACGCVQVAHNA